MSKTLIYNKEHLRKKYPEVANAFEMIMAENKNIKLKFISSYMGYHNPATGRARGVTLGQVLETLEEFGYISKIKVSKKELSKKPSNQLLLHK